MKKDKHRASIAQITLEYWKDTLPPDLFRVFDRLLPKGIDPPKRDAGEDELLKFYRKLAPDRINALTDAATRLSFPILDARDLAKQADGVEMRNDMLTAVVSSDFPISSLRYFLDVVIIREMSAMFRGCSRAYYSCLDKAETVNQEIKCEREYQYCTNYVSIQIFFALNQELFIRKRRGFPFPPQPWPY